MQHVLFLEHVEILLSNNIAALHRLVFSKLIFQLQPSFIYQGATTICQGLVLFGHSRCDPIVVMNKNLNYNISLQVKLSINLKYTHKIRNEDIPINAVVLRG